MIKIIIILHNKTKPNEMTTIVVLILFIVNHHVVIGKISASFEEPLCRDCHFNGVDDRGEKFVVDAVGAIRTNFSSSKLLTRLLTADFRRIVVCNHMPNHCERLLCNADSMDLCVESATVDGSDGVFHNVAFSRSIVYLPLRHGTAATAAYSDTIGHQCFVDFLSSTSVFNRLCGADEMVDDESESLRRCAIDIARALCQLRTTYSNCDDLSVDDQWSKL